MYTPPSLLLNFTGCMKRGKASLFAKLHAEQEARKRNLTPGTISLDRKIVLKPVVYFLAGDLLQEGSVTRRGETIEIPTLQIQRVSRPCRAHESTCSF